MQTQSALGVLVAALLLISSPMVAIPRVSSPSDLPYQIVLSPDFYQSFQIDAPSSNTTIVISVISNTSLSIALMTDRQFYYFDNGMSDISAAMFLRNSSSVQHSASVTKGLYYVVFYAYGTTANVTYNFQTNPISPYLAVPLYPPQPTGLAAFGIYNDSGKVTSYTVKSSDVLGVAQIGSILAHNASAPSFNDTVSGATLQLNAILVVNEQGGLQQHYWVQITPDFVTSANLVSWADNIWNASVSGVLSNSTITSADGGYAYSYDNNGTPGYYYSIQSSNSSYKLPLQLALVMDEAAIPGRGVLVQMGVQVIGNGSAPARPVEWFDNATILDTSVQSAYFYVSGNDTLPNGLFYESELVFGGEGNGESTTFNQLNAYLGLFYGNSTRGPQTAYPSFYTFGGNTGEATYDLRVSHASGAFYSISTGTPNYVYLGRASGSYSLPLAGTTVTVSFSSDTSADTTSQSTSTTGPSLLSIPTIVGAVVVVLLVLAFLVVIRRRGSRETVLEAPYPPQPVSRLCGRCGTEIEPDAKFCPNCGAQLLSD